MLKKVKKCATSTLESVLFQDESEPSNSVRIRGKETLGILTHDEQEAMKKHRKGNQPVSAHFISPTSICRSRKAGIFERLLLLCRHTHAVLLGTIPTRYVHHEAKQRIDGR